MLNRVRDWIYIYWIWPNFVWPKLLWVKRGHAINYGDGGDKSGDPTPHPFIAEEREQPVSHHSTSYNPAICLSLLDTQRVAGPGQTH